MLVPISYFHDLKNYLWILEIYHILIFLEKKYIYSETGQGLKLSGSYSERATYVWKFFSFFCVYTKFFSFFFAK
jgi:hypothetical protein